MISLEADLVLLSLFLLAMTTLAASRSVSLLAASNAIVMICVLLLGVSPIDLFGYTNIACNIFYAVGMFGCCLQFFVCGAAEALGAIRQCLIAFLLVFGSIFALEYVHFLDPMFDSRIQLAGARLLTFALVQSFHVYLLGRPSRWPAPLHAVVVIMSMQVFDAIIYFPIAFIGLLPPENILEYGIVGLLTRLAVTLLSGPFLAVLPLIECCTLQPDPRS